MLIIPKGDLISLLRQILLDKLFEQVHGNNKDYYANRNFISAPYVLNFRIFQNSYLRFDLHRHVALLIVELAMKYVPENNPTQTFLLLSEGMKQVIVEMMNKEVRKCSFIYLLIFNFAQVSSMVHPQSNEQVFSVCAWDTIASTTASDQAIEDCATSLLEGHRSYACVAQLLQVRASGNCTERHTAVFLRLSGIAVDESEVYELGREIAAGWLNLHKASKKSHFPGMILKIFGNMIQYQLQNSRRFLNSFTV